MGPGHFVLDLLQRLDRDAVFAGAGIIAGSAALEHVFPPFPGDLGVTLGAAVGFARDWSVALLFSAAVTGGVLGSTLTWLFGRWLEARSHAPKHPWVQRVHDQVLAATRPLDRHGLGILVVSRFASGVRAFVVIAAGFRGLPLPRVLVAAALGSALWNTFLFTIASLVGRNLPALANWLDTYNRAAFTVVCAVGLGFFARWLWRRRRPA